MLEHGRALHEEVVLTYRDMLRITRDDHEYP